MEVGRLRDEVLARAGVTIDAWTAVQRQWLERMGAELERGRLELTNRYTQAFLARQRALQAPKPPLPLAEAAPLPVIEPAAAPPPAPTPTEIPFAPVPLAAAAPHDSQASARRIGAPLSLSPEEMAIIAAVPENISGDTTLPIPPLAQASPPPGSSLPFKSVEPTTRASLAAAPPAAPTMQRSFDTLPPPASEQIRETSKESIPFRAGHAPSVAKAPERMAPVPPPLPQLDVTSAAGETADLSEVVEQIRRNKGALPFQATAGQPATAKPASPPAPQVPSEVSSQEARPPTPGARADQTVAASLTPNNAFKLPFSAPPKPQHQSPQPARSPTGQGIPFSPRPAPPGDAEDAPTIYRPPSSPAAQAAVPSPPPELPTLTAYAQICAELRLDPSRAAAIRARHGLADDLVWGAALRYWQAELNNPTVREHWTRLVEQMMNMGKRAR